MTTTSLLLDSGVLELFRERAQVTQAQMAGAMGMPTRTYEDLVGNRSSLRPIHVNAAEWALLNFAARKEDTAILTPALRSLVIDLAKLIENEKPAS